jgi:hypothetical protein
MLKENLNILSLNTMGKTMEIGNHFKNGASPKSRESKISSKFGIVFFATLLIVTACNNKEEVEPTPNPQPVENSIQLEGNIQIPDNVPAEKIGTMEVISGFFSNTVTNTTTKSAYMTRSATGSNEKYCKVTTFPNVVQLHTVFNNGNPFMLGLSIGLSENANMNFNEESTAISLIFMNPLFTVNDPAKATTIVAKIKSAPSFNLLKTEIRNLMYQGSLNNMTPNIEVENLTNYNKVIYEALLSLNENYQIQQNGLQVFENTRVGNEIQFKIRNRLKRYSTIYAYKYKDGQLTKTDIKLKNSNLGYGPFEWIDCGSYDWIECWMQIFTLNFEDQITEETDFFVVNVENAEKIYLKCYGLGIADGNFPTIDSEAYLGGALAMAKTAVFDIVKPTVEVITGIKKFPKAGDLRGRDNDDPLYKLVMNYYEKLFKSSGTYTKFLKATSSALSSGNAKKEVMKTFWSVTKSFLIDEKNVELYIEILKKYATLTVAEKAALNKVFTAVFQVKAAADITENSLNLGEAVYATLATNWTTEFRINVDGTTDSQDDSNGDGLVAYYPFNGNANDESGNGNHGTVNGSSFVTAKLGQGIYFENSNNSSYYDVKDYVALPPLSLTDFSLGFWVKSYKANNYNHHEASIFSIGDHNDKYFILWCDNNNTGEMFFDYNGTRGERWNIQDDQWHFIAVVKSTETISLYMDNIMVESKPVTDYDFLNQPAYFSYHTWSHNSSSRFYGIIDDARIYNRALSDHEITALYNGSGDHNGGGGGSW